MFLITDMKMIFKAEFVAMFMIYLIKKFTNLATVTDRLSP